MTGVRRRGDGTRRKDGTWRIVLVLTDENGAQFRRYVEAPTQRDCQRKARAFLAAHRDRRPKPDMSVSEFLDLALERRFEGRCAEGTVRDYRRLLANWIGPRIGALALEDLKVAHVERVMRAAAAEGKPRTGNMIRSFLRAALRWGQKMDLVKLNAAELADPVREEPLERPMMLRSDLALVIAAETNPVRRALWTFLAETGLRPSEAVALTWSEIREIEGEWWLRVERSKTAAGRRPVPLDPDLVHALRAIRQDGCDLCFPTLRCRELDSGNLNRAWYAAIDRANEGIEDEERRVPRTNLYQLRKLFGREMARVAPDHVLKRLMGHTDIATTKRFYVDAEMAEMREALRRRDAGGGTSGGKP